MAGVRQLFAGKLAHQRDILRMQADQRVLQGQFGQRGVNHLENRARLCLHRLTDDLTGDFQRQRQQFVGDMLFQMAGGVIEAGQRPGQLLGLFAQRGLRLGMTGAQAFFAAVGITGLVASLIALLTRLVAQRFERLGVRRRRNGGGIVGAGGDGRIVETAGLPALPGGGRWGGLCWIVVCHTVNVANMTDVAAKWL